jgi:predicted GIY-YIG superfamily endonuclease
MCEERCNLLDYFDENICNLDLTKNYIYVLKLVEERYYVGRTGNILRRIKEHFTVGGALYTKKYKPLKVIEVEEETSRDDETKMTFKYVEKYGWEKVRGSYWCSIEIKKFQNIESYQKMKSQRDKELLEIKKLDEQIRKMYMEENKNIIEIGESVNITPGSVACRLQKLKIIEDKQHAIGYDEYKDSDLYKQICNQSHKREKKDLSDEVKQLKDRLKNIKNLIKLS